MNQIKEFHSGDFDYKASKSKGNVKVALKNRPSYCRHNILCINSQKDIDTIKKVLDSYNSNTIEVKEVRAGAFEDDSIDFYNIKFESDTMFVGGESQCDKISNLQINSKHCYLEDDLYKSRVRYYNTKIDSHYISLSSMNNLKNVTCIDTKESKYPGRVDIIISEYDQKELGEVDKYSDAELKNMFKGEVNIIQWVHPTEKLISWKEIRKISA